MSNTKISAGIAKVCSAHREHLELDVRSGMVEVGKAAVAAKVTAWNQQEAITCYTSKAGGGYAKSTAKFMANIDALVVYHCREGNTKRLEKILDAASKLPENKRFSSRDAANSITAMRRVRDAEYIDENGKLIPAMKRGEYEPAAVALSQIPAILDGATKAAAKRTKVASANREATTERKALELAMAFIKRSKFSAQEAKGRDVVVAKLEARIEKLKAE